MGYLPDARVQWRSDGLGYLTTFGYPTPYVVDVVDPLAHTTRQEYDGLFRLLKETDPLTNTISYEYDGAGNRRKTTDANGSFSELSRSPRALGALWA